MRRVGAVQPPELERALVEDELPAHLLSAHVRHEVDVKVVRRAPNGHSAAAAKTAAVPHSNSFLGALELSGAFHALLGDAGRAHRTAALARAAAGAVVRDAAQARTKGLVEEGPHIVLSEWKHEPMHVRGALRES